MTPVTLPPREVEIHPRSRVLLLGSCFADHIGERLSRALPQGNVTVNPHGVLYNPLSVAKVVDTYLPEGNGDSIVADCFEAADGIWRNWRYDTFMEAATKEELKRQLLCQSRTTQKAFEEAELVVLTLSTDHAYLLRRREGAALNRVVTNCHKMAQGLFDEVVPTEEELFTAMESSLRHLLDNKPQRRVVFTLSPFRYRKYGMHENALSKARLLLLIDRLERRFDRVCYFPAYEIVTDELRDYRFYRPDMVHPSEQAVDYVWKRFSEWTFSPEMKQYAEEKARLTARLSHRPLHPDSPAHRAFRQQTEKMQSAFEEKWNRSPLKSPNS